MHDVLPQSCSEDQGNKPSATLPAVVLRPLRWFALLSFSSFVLLVGLLWGQFRFRVLHPSSLCFLVLLALLVGSALGSLVGGLWRIRRGPQNAAPSPCTLPRVLPLLLSLS